MQVREGLHRIRNGRYLILTRHAVARAKERLGWDLERIVRVARSVAGNWHTQGKGDRLRAEGAVWWIREGAHGEAVITTVTPGRHTPVDMADML